ncbi:MAG: HesA/MoeB/ThiF family protein [Deltaproteobacteria bacterium]|jgi:molybdopterin/thiamine biosynthesis adenylyltransferase|nr:HesA/MoeB/ThiF family protein [Deltaproteobacteria bacterium]
MALTSFQLELYSRNILVKDIGVLGQKKLLAGRVLIVGVGGLGSPAALYLAAAGVGTIGLLDSDQVELSNLQRQILYANSDLGTLKVDSGAAKLVNLNPNIEVLPIKARLTRDNVLSLLRDFDFVVDGADDFATKFILNDACVNLKIPLVHAGVLGFQGQLTTITPGAGPCLRCLFEAPPPPGAAPTCAKAGIVGAVAGVVGSLEALEAIKFLTGAGNLLTGILLTFNGLNQEFRRVKFPPRLDCPVCGQRG